MAAKPNPTRGASAPPPMEDEMAKIASILFGVFIASLSVFPFAGAYYLYDQGGPWLFTIPIALGGALFLTVGIAIAGDDAE